MTDMLLLIRWSIQQFSLPLHRHEQPAFVTEEKWLPLRPITGCVQQNESWTEASDFTQYRTYILGSTFFASVLSAHMKLVHPNAIVEPSSPCKRISVELIPGMCLELYQLIALIPELSRSGFRLLDRVRTF